MILLITIVVLLVVALAAYFLGSRQRAQQSLLDNYEARQEIEKASDKFNYLDGDVLAKRRAAIRVWVRDSKIIKD